MFVLQQTYVVPSFYYSAGRAHPFTVLHFVWRNFDLKPSTLARCGLRAPADGHRRCDNNIRHERLNLLFQALMECWKKRNTCSRLKIDDNLEEFLSSEAIAVAAPGHVHQTDALSLPLDERIKTNSVSNEETVHSTESYLLKLPVFSRRLRAKTSVSLCIIPLSQRRCSKDKVLLALKDRPDATRVVREKTMK
ncbi:hypothetical protein EVAR_95829_1 [Eumeta japonica]|uniref:Uncharacterized protein n=1 Tax=Eumeta variegata TaxID=151549 RepID=A0A4C1VJU5_EUMVA|nr:hypothetical protein EVAR_95829_1 [Eumeta japonica]